jgi:hypothetical protein
MYLGRSVASAAPELGNLPQQTFGHFSSQFFTGDSLGERVTIQADHQHALTARIKAIADDVRTVIPKEGAASALPLASKGSTKCRTGFGSSVPVSSY